MASDLFNRLLNASRPGSMSFLDGTTASVDPGIAREWNNVVVPGLSATLLQFNPACQRGLQLWSDRLNPREHRADVIGRFLVELRRGGFCL